MDKNIKLIAICVIAAALIIAAAIVSANRYEAHPLGQLPGVVVIDNLTGDAKVITTAEKMKAYEIGVELK